MENVTCLNCGHIGLQKREKKANNLVCHCEKCGKFIKNLPYAKPALYFGKYKDILIEDYNTKEMIQYLRWIKNTPEIWDKKLKESVKSAIIKQIGNE